MLYCVWSVCSERAMDGETAVRRLRSPFPNVIATSFFLLVWLVTVTMRAQPSVPPILSIGLRSNQLQLTILNVVTGRVYQIQQRTNLNSSTSWTSQILGAPGQTNFTIGAPS